MCQLFEAARLFQHWRHATQIVTGNSWRPACISSFIVAQFVTNNCHRRAVCNLPTMQHYQFVWRVIGDTLSVLLALYLIVSAFHAYLFYANTVKSSQNYSDVIKWTWHYVTGYLCASKERYFSSTRSSAVAEKLHIALYHIGNVTYVISIKVDQTQAHNIIHKHFILNFLLDFLFDLEQMKVTKVITEISANM